MRASSRIITYTVFLLVTVQSLWCITAQAGRRSFAVNDKIPEFSGTTVEGQPFTYKHNQGKALMVVFLSPGHKRSARAVKDIDEIISQLGANVERLETVIAIDEPNNLDLSAMQNGTSGNLHVLLDSEYKLWGRFGIIAVPTVVISDTSDKVICIKAGHGYNFAPVVQAYLNQALGLTQKKDPEEASQVKTVANDTTMARIKRHLQMAKMLEQKGRLESAIAEMQKARELDPESTEAALELGELFCRAGRSKEAVDTTKSLKVTKRFDKARLLMISGWAKHQMGELDEAEKLLLEATKLDPKSTRALFELGKIYQSRQEIDKAMKSFRKALMVIFNEQEATSNSR
ncbi:MAG: tetratricopeptide repeat protein [Planctomycetota bacterium]|jgi:Tfp pilus assembly protein PilF